MMRTIVRRLLLLAPLLASGVSSGPAAAQNAVTFTTFGGITQEAAVEGLLAEARQLGIRVNPEVHGGWPGVRAHLSAGAPGWDIISIGFARCEAVSQAGWLRPLDYGIVDRSRVPENLARRDYVGMYTFTYGIAYNRTRVRTPPQSWADFWDVSRFPGRRALMGEGLYALEAALMADGVPADQVYATLRTPAGLDRAFAKLEQIKRNVAIWWRSPAQASQLLRDGEVDMILITSSRAADLAREGGNVGFVWNQAFLDAECWMVPRNAPNPEGAMRLINSALDPRNQANFANRIGFGPINPRAFDTGIIRRDSIPWLPTAPDNVGLQLRVDQGWYASAEADAAYQRFSRFLQQ
ncbi:ABC transporter substrate-binding protein (plasmid) [Roseomonas sp. CCTCC AB2023176]|uniref:ABC transporter substrate-binding protein n=1 Tax=Roseomonas sp. CCTCC AB2023176 TaxID=3342640 RepID=UPI0035DCC2D8